MPEMSAYLRDRLRELAKHQREQCAQCGVSRYGHIDHAHAALVLGQGRCPFGDCGTFHEPRRLWEHRVWFGWMFVGWIAGVVGTYLGFWVFGPVLP